MTEKNPSLRSCERLRGPSKHTHYAYLHRNEIQDQEVLKTQVHFASQRYASNRWLAVRDGSVTAGDRSPVCHLTGRAALFSLPPETSSQLLPMDLAELVLV